MFIRKTRKKDPITGKHYHLFQLVESIRTSKGPRQRTLLSLGSSLPIPEEQYKSLANRIEEILNGVITLLPYSKEIEDLAHKYAEKLLQQRFTDVPLEEKKPSPKELITIDASSMKCQQPRTIGGEHLLLHAAKQLKLSEKFKELEYSPQQIALSLGTIIGRAIYPASERATHIWLSRRSGLGELIDCDFCSTTHHHLYNISDLLLKHKAVLEKHIVKMQRHIHGYQSTLLIYDITNTYMEGQSSDNPKAEYGRSKERRTDCPLVALGIALNEQGFISHSSFFEGNVAESKTLEQMIDQLNMKETFLKPIIVLDAGIASEDNLTWLRAQGYSYIVSSRTTPVCTDLAEPLKTVSDEERLEVKAALVQQDGGEEQWLYCESQAKAAKASEMKAFFQKRYEADLQQIARSLSTPLGRKKYPKILERLGRLKEKHKRISSCYEVIVTPSEDGSTATSITWSFLSEKLENRLNGHYFLRAYNVPGTAKELWKLYRKLGEVEDAFRCMKSELGMRPVYHRKESRVDGHLWITILAYSLVQTCLYQLEQQGIRCSWETLRSDMSTRMRVTIAARREDDAMCYYRVTTDPEEEHKKIYKGLGLSPQISKTKKFIG